MFGTIFRVQPRPGHEQSVTEYFERWEQQRSGNVRGYTGMTVLRPAATPGELLGAVVFRDRETYEANAADPDMDRWYQQLRSHLIADPIWEDGEVIWHSQKRAGVTR